MNKIKSIGEAPNSRHNNELKRLARSIEKLAFTDIKKGRLILNKMESLLNKKPEPDFYIMFLLYSGFIENQEYNYLESKNNYIKALEYLEERGDIHQKAETKIDLSGTYINLGQMEDATKLLDNSKRLLNAFPNKNLTARVLCREGYIHLHYNNPGSAIESFLEAEKQLTGLFDELSPKDYFFLTLIYSGLGNVYVASNEQMKGVKAYLSAVNLCETLDMRTRLSWHYLNIGNAYMAIKDSINAELYFQKAIASEADSSQQSRALAIGNIGFLALQKNEPFRALEYFDEAETIHREHHAEDFRSFARLNYWRGKIYSERGKKRKAVEYYEMAYDQAGEVKDLMQLCAILKDLSIFYSENNDYENAYHHQSLYEDMYEEYLEEVKNRRMMELEVHYESEKKKQEAENLKLQATKLQLKALRAQMNPHFMHNALNAIQTYISSGDAKNASLYLARFSALMRKSLDFSDLEVISLEEEVDFLREYLSLNQNLRFEGSLAYEINVDEDVEEDICGVPTMIIQPYVENAIEHGIRRKTHGKITVNFKMLGEDKLLCVIEDDGIGRAEARRIQSEDPRYKDHRSRGTYITEDRLKILFNVPAGEKYVEIIDNKDDFGKGTGTRVEIQIPITEINMVNVEDDI